MCMSLNTSILLTFASLGKCVKMIDGGVNVAKLPPSVNHDINVGYS